MGSTPSPSSTSEDSSITPPEAWGGEKPSDKYGHMRILPSRLGMFASSGQNAGSVLSGLPDLSLTTSQPSISSSTNINFGYANLRTKDASINQETSLGLPEHLSTSMSMSLGSKGIVGQTNLDSPATATRRFSTYAERISTTSSFSDGTSALLGSPKIKKTGAETREELLSSLFSKSDASGAVEKGMLPMINVRMPSYHFFLFFNCSKVTSIKVLVICGSKQICLSCSSCYNFIRL